MKKVFSVLNILLFAATCVLTVYYDYEGGLWLKGLTGSGFVALGIVNLIYAIVSKTGNLRFPQSVKEPLFSLSENRGFSAFLGK